MDSQKTLQKKANIKGIIMGGITAVCFTLILILLFALIVRFTKLQDKFIFPINQVIKCISLFFGMMVCLKGYKEKGFLNGICLGFVYFVVSIIIFSILQGGFSFKIQNLYDLILTTLMSGLIGGIEVHIGK